MLALVLCVLALCVPSRAAGNGGGATSRTEFCNPDPNYHMSDEFCLEVCQAATYDCNPVLCQQDGIGNNEACNSRCDDFSAECIDRCERLRTSIISALEHSTDDQIHFRVPIFKLQDTLTDEMREYFGVSDTDEVREATAALYHEFELAEGRAQRIYGRSEFKHSQQHKCAMRYDRSRKRQIRRSEKKARKEARKEARKQIREAQKAERQADRVAEKAAKRAAKQAKKEENQAAKEVKKAAWQAAKEEAREERKAQRAARKAARQAERQN